MDDLDRKILSLLAKNARMPVKEIAEQVALTSPAVSSRIHKLETDGIISGYTVVLNRPADRVYVDALISLSVTPSHRDELVELMQNSHDGEHPLGHGLGGGQHTGAQTGGRDDSLRNFFHGSELLHHIISG